MSVPGGSVGTAFIEILPNTDKFVASLVAQMKTVGAAANAAGDEAIRSSVNWNVLGGSVQDAGQKAALSASGYKILGEGVSSASSEATQSLPSWAAQATLIGESGDKARGAAVDYAAMAAATDVVTKQIDQMTAAIAANGLLRGGGITGGPPGKGIATDLGSAFRDASNLAQGFLGVITLIAPTINIIIAALVGVVSLLGTAVIAATAFAVALGATAAAMAFAAFKWRDLLVQGQQGATTWQNALIAIEAQAFNMAQGVVDSFAKASGAGGNFWQSVGRAGVDLLAKMQPVIDWIVSHVMNFIDALNGVGGATSPFLEFMKTWLNEWKVLGAIINEGIAGGGGLLAFFQKYEAPAKAFVEGIAQVINAIRKMSAMGLGLNMDQLAEFIRNVFTALSSLITVFPKFSNALVMVGLQVTRFINEIMPIVGAAIEIGSAILQHIVAPIVDGLIVALETLLKIPGVGFLVSLAGGFTLVAVAISKLTLSRVPFTLLMKTMINGLIALATQLGTTVLSLGVAQEALGAFGTEGMATAVGFGVIAAVIVAAYFTLRGPMHEVAQMSTDVANTFKESWAQMEAGAISGSQVLADTYNQLQTSFNSLSNLGKLVYGVENFGDSLRIVFLGTSVEAVLTAKALDQLREAYAQLDTELANSVLSGGYTEAQATALKQMRQDFIDFQTASPVGPSSYDTTYADSAAAIDEQVANYDRLKIGADEWVKQLNDVNAAYADGIINEGQYSSLLGDLYGKTTDVATATKIQALAIEGGVNTISQALIELGKNSGQATGGLAQFASATGQAFTTLKQAALDAFNDPTGGLTGTGAKVTEFFQQQSDVIDQWKQTTADSFNFVNTALAGLATGAAVSFDKIKSTLQSAVQDTIDYGKNWDKLVADGASQKLKQQIVDMGQAGAPVLAGLVQGGKKGIAEVNKLVAKGASLSEALAANMADALNITMEKLTYTLERIGAEILGIPFPEFKRQVDDAVNHFNHKTAEMKDKTVTLTVKTMYEAHASRTQQAMAADTGGAGSGTTAKAVIPPPDTSAIRSQWVPAGQAAVDGMAQGLKNNQNVTAAATDMGNAAIKATAQSIGAASPATKFIAIGRDAVDGLIKGVSSATGTLTAQMTRTGHAMASAVQAGLSGKGLGANTIKTEFTNTGTAAGEGLVRGLRRSLDSVVSAGKALGNRAANAIDIRGKYVIAGAAAGQGLAQGITRSLGVVIAAGKALSNKAANTISIKGKYTAAGKAAGQGLAQGISDSSGKVTAAATQIGVKTVKATTTSIGGPSASKFVEIGKSAVIGIASGVSRTLGTLVSQMSRAGAAMAAGLRAGLLGGLAGIQASAVSSVQALVNAVNQVLRTASPSKVFYDIGQNIAEGLRLGIGDGMKKVNKDMTAHAKGLGENFKVPTPKIPAIAAKIPAPKVPIPAPPIHAKISPIPVPPIHAKIPVPTHPIHAGIPRHLRHPHAIDVPVMGGALQHGGHRGRNEMRIRDWRTGLATLESELGWEDAVRTR